MHKKHKPYPKSKLVNRLDYNYGDCWTTLDGQTILLEDLRPQHLLNILEHLKERMVTSEYVFYIEKEIHRRELKKLIRNTKAGKILYG